MEAVGGTIVLASIAVFVSGMIRPEWVLPGLKKPTRLKAFGVAFGLFWIGGFLVGANAPAETKRTDEPQVSWSSNQPAATAPTEPANNETATQTDQSDPNELVHNKKFRDEQPGYTDAIRKLIIANGYECPKLHLLWVEGNSPYGPRLEALCGPEDQDTITRSQHYAVYPKQLKVNVCDEYSAFGSECK